MVVNNDGLGAYQYVSIAVLNYYLQHSMGIAHITCLRLLHS